jgi:hypothetical protein
MSILTRQRSVSEETLQKFEDLLISERVALGLYIKDKITREKFCDCLFSTVKKLEHVNTRYISKVTLSNLEETAQEIKNGRYNIFNFDTSLSFIHRSLIVDAYPSQLKQEKHYAKFVSHFSSASWYGTRKRVEALLRE